MTLRLKGWIIDMRPGEVKFHVWNLTGDSLRCKPNQLGAPLDFGWTYGSIVCSTFGTHGA